ncbi:MAG: HD domain-containing protein [Gallionella sp.]|nr:HD domain-containing protein [Gallionella sp.]
MNDDNPASAQYLQPDQLRVGIFVKLELSWFKHGFARSDFKIGSEKQLREVLALRLPRYRHDPRRSDAPAAVLSNQESTDAIPPTPDEHEVSDNLPLPDRSDGPTEELPSQAPAETMPTIPADLDANETRIFLDEQRRARFLEQRAQRIKEVETAFIKAATVLKNLNRNLLSTPKETLDDMGALVDEMSAAFLESPDVTLHIMGENVGGEDVYHHPLNVAILAMMLARDLGFSSKKARELGIGALVHDIGLMKIPGRVLLKPPDEYTTPERNLRAKHVEYGVEIGRDLGFSTDVLAVIAQHHEFADGSGYPNSLKEAAMTPAARVVSIVNYYDNLCNPVDFSRAMTPHEALSLMFAQRRSKFEARSMALMIRCLGVYPPGSIVQLSNEALATVISVNPKISTRPCVLVYDNKVPKEKAIILNLENELDISIKKSIRPATLPPKVAAYLNPRKRVTYFFDSDEQPEDA